MIIVIIIMSVTKFIIIIIITIIKFIIELFIIRTNYPSWQLTSIPLDFNLLYYYNLNKLIIIL
jgi:hypothetical protein